jgi:uncharacterized membrane protein
MAFRQFKSITKQSLTIIVLILVVGWLLRIYNLDANSMWGDEVKSFSRASLTDWKTAQAALISANHAPLYEWLILHYWLEIGTTELITRFPGALLSVLTISITYSLGKLAFGELAGLWAAFLLAISPLHVRHARQLRPYALMVLLVTLMVYCLLRAISSQRRWYWIAYSILGAAALYTHYFSVFTLAALGLYVAWVAAARRDFVLLRRWTMASVATGVMFIPWLNTFRNQLADGAVEWIPSLSVKTVLELPAHFFAWNVFSDFASIAVIVASWTMLFFGLVAWIWANQPKVSRRNHLFIAFATIGTIALAAIASLIKPVFVARYFVGILPTTYVIISYALIHRKVRRWLVVPVILLLFTALTSSYLLVNRLTVEDWKGTVAYIEANANPDDTIVLVNAERFWVEPFEHYYQGPSQPRFVSGTLNDPKVVSIALKSFCPCERIWFIESARKSTSALTGDPFENHSEYRLVGREKFNQNLISSHLAVDVLLGEKE